MTTFMIIGRTKIVPNVNHVVLEKQIESGWLMDEKINCFKCLHSKGLNVKTCFCDNLPTSVSAFRKLLALYGKEEDSLRIYNEVKLIYLLFDAIHLIKNISNNLIHQKRRIFPPFSSNHLRDKPFEVRGGEISQSLFHKAREKDMNAKQTCQPQQSCKQKSFMLETANKMFVLLQPSLTLLPSHQSNINFPTTQIMPSFQIS